MDQDEIIKTMQNDQESSKYISERLNEILHDSWSSEREVTIMELTKQVGVLEMQNKQLESQIRQSTPVSPFNNTLVKAKLDSQDSEITKLRHELDLKDQEICMVKSYQSHILTNQVINNQNNREFSSLNIGKL